VNSGICLAVGNDQLNFYFWQEIHGILAAAIEFSLAFLTAKTLDLAYGHAGDAHSGKGFFYFFELERFNNCLNFFISIHFGIGRPLDGLPTLPQATPIKRSLHHLFKIFPGAPWQKSNMHTVRRK
jgi:hypothetical protein